MSLVICHVTCHSSLLVNFVFKIGLKFLILAYKDGRRGLQTPSHVFVGQCSGLTQENRNDLERTQKTFLKLVLQEEYQSYNNALKISQLETLDKRREELTLRFAQTSLADGLFHDLFPIRKKQHTIRTRNRGRFKGTVTPKSFNL